MEDMECLSLVTKRLYPEIARYHNTALDCAEGNIRTVVQSAWSRKPTTAQFITLLANYFLNRNHPT